MSKYCHPAISKASSDLIYFSFSETISHIPYEEICEQIRTICKRGLPKESWPDVLMPLPHVWKRVARAIRSSDPDTTLKIMLRQCFVINPQMYGATKGPLWVNDLWLVVQSLLISVNKGDYHKADDDRPLSKGELMRREVSLVYLVSLIEETDKWYGADTTFAGYLKTLLQHQLVKDESEMKSNRFSKNFRQGQKALFEWAQIPDAGGIVVTKEGYMLK